MDQLVSFGLRIPSPRNSACKGEGAKRIPTDKFNNLYRKLGIEDYIIHHTNPRLFGSVQTVEDFPDLDLSGLFDSATRGLYNLKDSINSLILKRGPR